MAKNLNEKSIKPILRAATQLYKAAKFGSERTNISESSMLVAIDQIIQSYNSVRGLWDDLVGDVGGAQARILLANTLHPTPADVGALIVSLRQNTRSVLQAYNAHTPNAGTRTHTFDFTVVDSIINGGSTELIISEADLVPIQAALVTLRDTAEELAAI